MPSNVETTERQDSSLITLKHYHGRMTVAKVWKAWSSIDMAYWAPEAYREPLVEWRSYVLPRVFLVNDLDLIDKILVRNAHDTDKHGLFRTMAESTLSGSIVLARGETWRATRSIAARFFSPRAVEAQAPRIAQLSDVAEQHLRSQELAEVDLLREACRFTSAVVASVVFGPDFLDQSFDETYDTFVFFDREGYRKAFAPLMLEIAFNALSANKSPKTFKKAEGLRTIYGAEIAAQRAAVGAFGAEDCYLGALLAAQAEGRPPLTDEDLISLVLELRYAGSHAAGNALAFLWYVLLAKPEVAEALRAEAAAPGGLGALADAVIDESLRLYPRAPALTRTPLEPMAIGDRVVRPGEMIAIVPWILHRHEAYWRDPATFDPSRFLGANRQDLKRHQFMPFGAGPRKCVSESLSRVALRAGLDLFLRLGPLRLANGEAIGLHLTGSTLALTPALRARAA